MQKLNTVWLKDHLSHVKANGVSHDPKNGLQRTLDFQDAIGTATPEEIRLAYVDLSNEERRTFLFAATASLSPDSAESVIRWTTVALLRCQELEGLEEEWKALQDERYRLFDAKKAIHKKLKDHKDRISALEHQYNHWRRVAELHEEEARRLRFRLREDMEDARKYRELKSLLAS